jgi:hypothetical protein
MRLYFFAFILLLTNGILNSQSFESVSWEDLFSVYRAEQGMKQNAVLSLGFDFHKRFKLKSGKECSEYRIRLGTGLQGEWIETVSVCDGSSQVIYSTENSTFFLDLRSKLLNEYGFNLVDTTGTKGKEFYRNKNNLIEIANVTGDNSEANSHRLSKHVIKIVKLNESIASSIQAERMDFKDARNHALIIGISNYPGITNDLRNPVNDAQRLKQVLTTEFNFEKSNVILLNDTAGVTVDQITLGIESFLKLTKDDNLVIFFAGHGFVRGQGNNREGYWRTSSSIDPSSDVGSISNSDLVSKLKQINAGHILVISDACFGGSLLIPERVEDLVSVERDASKLYAKKSREAISSAGLQETPDNSVFFEEMLKIFNDQSFKYLSAEELFINLQNNLRNNIKPVYGTIQGLGDNRGNFYFIRH